MAKPVMAGNRARLWVERKHCPTVPKVWVWLQMAMLGRRISWKTLEVMRSAKMIRYRDNNSEVLNFKCTNA